MLALSQNGFSGSVSLSATNLPKGVKAVISPNPVSVVSYGESTLTLFADGTATPGQSTITVNGVSGALSATTTVQITVAVPTFTLSTSSSVTMGQGSSTTTYVTVGAQSGFAGSVTMSVAGLPAGVTGIWSNNPATSSANLAISASSTAVPGQYPLTFTGVYGSQIVTTTSTLIVVVPSFTLYTNSATLGIGSSTSNYVSVESQYGFSGSVTFSVSGLPAGVSGSFSPVSSTYSTSLGLVASSSAVAGAYTVTVTGTSGSVSAKTTFTLTVGPPAFTLSGLSSLTLGQGSTATSYVYVNSTNGFSGSVNLSIAGLPGGVTAVFSQNPTTYSSSLSFTASSSVAPGQYNVTVSGTSGSLTASTTLLLTVAVPSFTLTSYLATPVPVGGSGNGYAYISAMNGFGGNVTMSASGMPAGLAAAFSPNPTTYESSITFTAASTLAPGTYPVTITGVSGTLTASTTLSVTVALPSFTLSGPTSVSMGQSSTSTNYIDVTNGIGFSGSVTLSVSGLPAGVTASFGTNPTTYYSSIVLVANASAAFGTSTITVTGTSGALSASTTFPLTITPAAFAIAAPYGLSLNPGGSSSGTITVTDEYGFSGSVSFAAMGLPSGVTATVTPNPTTANPQLTLTASNSVVPGTYSYTVTGTSGSLSATAMSSLTVNTPSYGITTSKAEVFVPIGGTATTSIAVVPTNGFSGGVALAVTGLPPGVTGTLSTATDTTTSTLTFTATSAAAAGYSNIVIQGTYGGALSQINLLLDVLPAQTATATSLAFTAGGSSVVSVAAGTPVTATISVLSGMTPVTAGTVYLCSTMAPRCNGAYQIATGQLGSAGTTALRFIPGAGVRSYVAAYAGTQASVASLSTASSLTVTASIGTITTLAQSGSSGNYTLNATTTAQGDLPPTGTVSFLDTTANNAVLATHAVVSSAIGVTQSASQTIATGTSPRYSVVADFNGDGYPDLAVTNTGGTSVSILLNNRGTFTVGASLLVTSAPTSIATGDFNGDGKADIAVTLASLNSIAVFLGNGDGTFSSPVLYSTSPGPGNLVVGDYNRDGNMDLAIVTSNGLLSLLLGNGNGTFTLSNISPSVSYYAQGIAQADLNGDGILDLVISSSSYEDLQVLLGNGDGTFSALTAMNSVNGPGQVVVADFNQDGVPDLAVASNFGTAVGVYLGNGDGTFAAAATPPFSGTIYAIAAADISGDGIPDLIAADIFGDRVITVTGKGDGTFASASIVSTGSNPEFVVAGDWNGDGVEDLAVPNLSGASATIVMSQLAQTVAATVSGISPDGTGPHKVVAVYSGDAAYASSTSAATTLTAIAGAPTVTVTLPSSSITAAQALSVAINVSGIPGDPVATGTITLSSGSFLSAAVPLSSGGASMTIPAKTLTVGQDKITAVYTPDSSSTGTYTTASGSAMITITQASPTITWLPPSAIVYGTALGGTQLNVTSSVPGTFLYSPAAGAVLSAGNQTLSVIFTPTDGTTYVSETASVPLTVLPAPLTVTIGSTSRAFGAANPAFTGSISGYVNGDNGSVVSGSPILSTTAALNSPAGTYPITGSTGTLSAANYSFNLLPGTLTVLGGATQAITFQPIPNVPLGLGRLTLTAHSTSGGLGQPIVYSVTGPASISGSTLILTGAGTVTVTASEAGNATFAAAIPISQTFTVTP